MDCCQNGLKTFEEALYSEEKSRNTVDKYLRDVRRYLNFSGGEISRERVLEYKNKLLESYSAVSANSMLASLNKYLKYCGEEGCCVRHYRIQKKIFCSEERELTRQEYERLVLRAGNTGNKRLGLIIQTLCGTGIRISELEYITVSAVERGEAVVSCKGKTRIVFIVKRLRKLLYRYIKEEKIKNGSVFVTKNGRPVNRCNIWRDMKSLCQGAGVLPSKVFPHNLRHLFARIFYKMEKDIAKLADILGHTSIDTTRIYILSTGQEHRRRIERMHLII